ncbi:dCTP deaminase [Roseateles sp.]|uniref:dCTP deaminase n=1 Tax=Roseateles sp. TaxID=1971397 RepID=UPI003D0AE817
MILTGTQIASERASGRILLSPFDHESITTNSYDLTLGDDLIAYVDPVLDPRRAPQTRPVLFNEDGTCRLERGDFVLGHSREIVGSDFFVPIIHARSSIARLGLFVHVTADLIDIGSKGQITFQLYATLPIILRRGMKLGQVSFWVPKGEITLYDGKYKNSTGPRSSMAFRDGC